MGNDVTRNDVNTIRTKFNDLTNHITCNTILLLQDVKLAKYMFLSQFANIFIT